MWYNDDNLYKKLKAWGRVMKKKKIILILAAILAVSFVASAVYIFAFYLPDRREEEERERLVKEYYENKYAVYESENAAFSDFEVDVAFLGDSLTDGYDLKRYYPNYTVANRGIGGETSHGLEKRLKLSLYDLKPKVAVILIGGNNLTSMLENYERMLIDIQENAPDTKIILCSLTSMGGRFKEKNEIAAYNNVVIKKLAEKYGFDFVDLYYPLFDESTGEIKAEYTLDGAHLTDEGYRVITDTIKPTLDAILE